MTYKLSIEPKKGRKGRVFQSFLLNYVTADFAWDCGSSSTSRPVYLAYTASDREAQAFTANLRTGRAAFVKNEYGHGDTKIEFLKTSGHRFVTRRCPRSGGALVTAYLPELFELDPGLVGERVRFVFAPASWWVEREVEAPPLRSFPPDERRELVVAASFAAFLDRRTPLPILNDPRFHRQLYLAARGEPWFRQPSGSQYRPGPLFVYPGELAGLELVALVDVDHETFETFLVSQTLTYFRTEVHHGKTRIPGRRRLLSDAPAAPLQLGLFDHLGGP